MIAYVGNVESIAFDPQLVICDIMVLSTLQPPAFSAAAAQPLRRRHRRRRAAAVVKDFGYIGIWGRE
jgi:hypothetical protein